MRAPHTELYVHLLWHTWDNLPLITPSLEPRIYAALAAKSRQLHCLPLAIGGTPDHIHLLVHLDATVCVADLAKELKGASSHLVTHILAPGEFFKWQGAYTAFTLRKEDLNRVTAYIQNQKQHHRAGTTQPGWERPLDEDIPVSPTLP